MSTQMMSSWMMQSELPGKLASGRPCSPCPPHPCLASSRATWAPNYTIKNVNQNVMLMWQVHCIHPCLMLNNALLRCCSIRGLHVTCRLYQHCALKCSPWPDACFVFLSIVAFRFQPARATTNRGDAVPGRPCPPALLEDEADALKDMKRCIEEFHDDKRCASAGSSLQQTLGTSRPLSTVCTVVSQLMILKCSGRRCLQHNHFITHSL